MPHGIVTHCWLWACFTIVRPKLTLQVWFNSSWWLNSWFKLKYFSEVKHEKVNLGLVNTEALHKAELWFKVSLAFVPGDFRNDSQTQYIPESRPEAYFESAFNHMSTLIFNRNTSRWSMVLVHSHVENGFDHHRVQSLICSEDKMIARSDPVDSLVGYSLR